MKKIKKQIITGLLVMAILTPLGILVPKWFHAGDAWGEWSVETIHEKTGFTPDKMKKTANLYKAPMAGYTIPDQKGSQWNEYLVYGISGLAGVSVIGLLTLLVIKIVRRNE